jgi:hypothetical protein
LDGREIVRKVEGEAVPLGGVGADVAEDAEGELVPGRDLQHVVSPAASAAVLRVCSWSAEVWTHRAEVF